MFYTGQKVICIASFEGKPDQYIYDSLGIRFPVLGAIYTVRAVLQELSDDDTAYGLLLEEIVNPVVRRHRSSLAGEFHVDDKGWLPDGETLFAACAFRPLLTVKDFATASTPAPVPA